MKNTRTFPSPFVYVAFALILIVFIAGIFFTSSDSEIIDAEVLPVSRYTDRPTNFIGNRYKLKCLIIEQLAQEEDVGRLFNIKFSESEVRAPMLVTNAILSNVDIQQRYEVLVLVDKGGLLVAEQLVKY